MVGNSCDEKSLPLHLGTASGVEVVGCLRERTCGHLNKGVPYGAFAGAVFPADAVQTDGVLGAAVCEVGEALHGRFGDVMFSEATIEHKTTAAGAACRTGQHGACPGFS